MGKNFLNFLFNSRKGYALFLAFVPVVLSSAMGALLALITGEFPSAFLKLSVASFVFWFAPGVVAALLLSLTSIPSNLVFGFGCGLYYGTVFATIIIDELWNYENFDILLGFVFVALICYIVWLKKFKNAP